MELRDKVAVVTGGGSGIGRAIAQRFAAEGARAVVVADLKEADAVATAEGIGSQARGVGLDVADEAAVKALVEDVENREGPIDVFVSNAGYGKPGGLELSNEDWQRMMDVHFMSHLYAARAVVPSMVARGEGYLFNTASAAGLLTQMDSGPYAVSKHAAVAFAEWLSINYGDQGIRVSVLCPQAVRTNILGDPAKWAKRAARGGQASQDGILEPEELAETVIQTMRDERFLCLPHPQVETYMQRKTGDYDRWLRGMRRFKERLGSMAG
ncbi:MAG: SDR family oxidoreductase [Acidimicrobiia bacterium]|nr:SDR family oxidoreductase [Acidimicrobiia bacterium]